MNKLTLELTLDEVNVILAGLGELPAKASLSVIERVRVQVLPQVQSQQAPAAMPDVSVEQA
jgi:hypothetical protein